jgi:hypothetical protein
MSHGLVAGHALLGRILQQPADLTYNIDDRIRLG